MLKRRDLFRLAVGVTAATLIPAAKAWTAADEIAFLDTRIVERLVYWIDGLNAYQKYASVDAYEVVKMYNLKKGDIFRIHESTGEYIRLDGAHLMIAMADGYKLPSGVYCVAAEGFTMPAGALYHRMYQPRLA